MALTEKQLLFVDEYMKNFDVYEAVDYAGYSNKSHSFGWTLLNHPSVRVEIEKRRKKMENKDVATSQEVLEFLTAVMRGKEESAVLVKNKGGDGSYYYEQVMKGPSEREKMEAAKWLGKRYGLFAERVDVSVNLPVVIQDDFDLSSGVSGLALEDSFEKGGEILDLEENSEENGSVFLGVEGFSGENGSGILDLEEFSGENPTLCVDGDKIEKNGFEFFLV